MLLCFVLLGSIHGFASCAEEGLKFHLNYVGTSGAQLEVFISNSFSGCYMHVTSLTFTLLNTSTTGGSANAAVWAENGTQGNCTGSAAVDLGAIGVVATKYSTTVYPLTFGSYESAGSWDPSGVSGGGLCFGFDAAISGVTESLVAQGYYTATQ
jgi:hypothetical protein